MPLHDHFHPPLSTRRHWKGFHGTWAGTLARRLNEILPARYYAEPTIDVGGQIEIDVATFDEEAWAPSSEGGVATAGWAPPQPPIAVPIDFTGLDVFEVRG